MGAGWVVGVCINLVREGVRQLLLMCVLHAICAESGPCACPQVGSIMINLGTNVMKMGHNKLAAIPCSLARPKPAI